MAKIISMEELKNVTKVSGMAHASDEPVFVTKDGQTDLVILSIENYRSLSGNFEHRKLQIPYDTPKHSQ